MRRKEKKLGDKTRDKEKWGDEMQDNKNGETRCKTKKMGR